MTNPLRFIDNLSIRGFYRAPGSGDLMMECADGTLLNLSQLFANNATVGAALALKADINSPTLTGTPAAPTPTTSDNSTKIATTAFVKAQAYAPLASPALTGTPTTTTAAADTNTTQIASTAYVVGQASSTTPNMDGTAAVGTSLKYARADHTHASDTSRAPLASPALTGTPTAPTAATATNTTQIATTAYVKNQAYAPLASPTFTGTPAAPAPAYATSSTQIATTAFVHTITDRDQRTTGQETCDRGLAQQSTALTSQRLSLSYFTATRSELVTQIRVATGGTAAGATPTLIRFGIYSLDGSDNLTLVASTANDTTLLAAQNTIYTKALSANYTFTAGSRYALAILIVTAAALPTITSATPGLGTQGTMFAVSPRLTGQLSSQSDLPSSATAASINATSQRFYLEALP